jgi:hypothetical protein
MKTIEFKFDLGDRITLEDRREGIISSLIYKDFHNKYKIMISERTGKNRITINYAVVEENELLAGHNLYKHERL